jgi:hypothetical protein
MHIPLPGRTLAVALMTLLFAVSGFAQQSAPAPAGQPTATTTQAQGTIPVDPVEQSAAPQGPATTAPARVSPEATGAAPTEKSDFALLVCYREKRFLGAALNTSVYVDDEEIADLDNGCYVIVKVKPGEHKLYADEKDDAFTVKVEAGKTYFYRMELAMGLWKGHGRLKEVDVGEGEKEFKEWSPDFATDIRRPEMVVKKY